MPQRTKRRMRCTNCGSLQTRKDGRRRISPISFSRRTKSSIQRYECFECGHSFSKRREKRKHYTFGFQREITRMHIEERLSYRVIAKRIGERLGCHVSPKALCGMVNAVARLSKSSIEIQREYRPCWSGYLTVDDKWICVKGTHRLSLVAVDQSGDALHSELYAEANQEVYDSFFFYLRDRLAYPLRAITTDLDPRLEKAIKRVFGLDCRHQQCLWHAGEIVKDFIDYPQAFRHFKKVTYQIQELEESLADRKQSSYDTKKLLAQLRLEHTELKAAYQDKEAFVDRFRALVFATERQRSESLWKTFRRLYRRQYPRVLRFVAAHWESLLQHQRDAQIPKTSAHAENLNKQFERRFKTIEAFQSVETAFQYQNLYRNYLRFKPYTDCRGARKACNGLSPLQVAQASIPSNDWLKYAIRYPK